MCIRQAIACPFKDPVNAPVCAFCFISLLPEVGFLVPAPGPACDPKGPKGAPPVAEMER